MKNIFPILLLLVSAITVSAQNLAQIAKQQIEKNVDLPAILAIEDSTVIKSDNLDNIIMLLPMKNNGRINTDNILFLQSSFTPINELMIAAATKVKLPRNHVTEADTLIVGISLDFENLNYHSKLPTTYEDSYKKSALPSTLSRFQTSERANRKGISMDQASRGYDGGYIFLGKKASGGGISPPCFRVTIVGTK